MKELTDENFYSELKKESTPAAIDLWAEWCAPCKMLSPIFDELSEDEELSKKIRFYKLNVDDNPHISAQFQIMSIPTVLIVDSDGKEINRKIGAAPKEILLNFIKDNLK